MESALLIAGGRSERLGQPKQSLEIEGETLAARTAGVLAQVARRVTVVGPPGERPDWVPAGCGWVGDPLPHGGPRRYSRKEISRTYQVMVKALKMHSMPPLPEDYLPRICSKLDLTPKVEGTARDLLRAAQDVPLTNSVPISLAAASVYIASIINNERRKQKDVARAADLTEVTIRSRYKEMAQFLSIDIHI